MEPAFGGETYTPTLDGPRLHTLLARVLGLMADKQWRTLAEIKAQVGGSEAGISARLRDLRKPRFGAFDVNRRRRGAVKAGLHEYQVIVYADEASLSLNSITSKQTENAEADGEAGATLRNTGMLRATGEEG